MRKTCDTRNRLNLCSGKDDDFKYCFRPAGNTSNIPENITPFNNVDELYIKNQWLYNSLKWLGNIELKLSEEFYGDTTHMRLLLGKRDTNNERTELIPVGYVIC